MSDAVQLRPMLGALVLTDAELQEQEQAKVTGSLGAFFSDQIEQKTGALTVDPAAPAKRKRRSPTPKVARPEPVVDGVADAPPPPAEDDTATEDAEDDELEDEDGDDDDADLPPLIPNL